MKNVRAIMVGYHPAIPGNPPQLIRKGQVFQVDDKAKAKWFEDVDAPAKRGRAAKDQDSEAVAES